MNTVELVINEKSVAERDGRCRVLLKDCVFTIEESQRSTALLGRSGAGKSTLLRMLAGLDVDYVGSYRFAGQVLERNLDAMARLRRRRIGYVTQDHLLLSERTVLDNVLIGRRRTMEARRQGDRLLERVGLGGFGSRRAARLSGGEAQRVCIARALVGNPELLLADEPTGALDEESENAILALFDELQRDGLHLVIATHSPVVAAACDVAVRIEDLTLVHG